MQPLISQTSVSFLSADVLDKERTTHHFSFFCTILFFTFGYTLIYGLTLCDVVLQELSGYHWLC